MFGIQRRLSRIFATDGRALIVAYDHGMGGANYGGMAKPAKFLPAVIDAGADAILTTIGTAHRFEGILARCGLMLNLDQLIGDEENAVREALLLGADIGKIMCFPWNPERPDSVARARRLATICHAWNFPLTIETIPVSFEATEAHTPEKIGRAARMGCELGADMIKMHYTGDRESFQDICERLYAPAVVLGGQHRNDDLGVLQDVHNALAGGAVGVAIGRNIWMNERPERMVAALAHVIHGDASPEEAARELQTT